MKKKLIYIGIVLLIIVVIAFTLKYSQQKAEDEKVKFIDNNDLVDLIQNNDTITDYNEQITVWREMFKACPFWTSYIKQVYNSSANKSKRDLGQTIDDQYTAAAISYIERGKDILKAYSNCRNGLSIVSADFYNGPENWKL